MLEGKKTYLIAAAAILSAVASALAGTLTWPEALALIVPAVLGMTVRAGVATEAAKRTIVPALLACLVLVGCATSPQTAEQPATVNPKGELGQSSTRATAAFLKSQATTDATQTSSPETIAVGGEVMVPFALWNGETKSWEIPLDKDGKPYTVHATAVRDFNYLVGTISNSASVSGTASGSQTQGGTAGATSGQTATPTNTTSPSTTLTK